MQSIVAYTRNWYARFERPISSLSLIGGFIFDALTLRRVDAFWDNIWIVAHLLIVAIAIIASNAIELHEGSESDPAKAHFWLLNVLQFFFGGLLSTYLVFYFRSASIAVSWPFILLLALAFIANESFKRHYVRASFQITLLYLSLFSFAIYLVPILLHQIGPWIFILSGIVSLVFISLFFLILKYFSINNLDKNKRLAVLSVLGTFCIINVFYFTNIIPPIPLSIKDAGVYHTIVRDETGNYTATQEVTNWKRFFSLYDDFHVTDGAPVYVYSAIYSPSDLNITIIHDWQHYDEQKKKWIDVSKVNLRVLGGRENGFRTYSLEAGLKSGKWRVNVETERGQVIGVVRFTIVPVASDVATEENKK